MQPMLKYGAIGRITMVTAFMYRSDLLIRCIGMGMILFVFVQLWSATFEFGGFRSVAGFTLNSLLWYLVITEAAVHTSDARLFTERIDAEVKSGDIALSLIRPFSYVGYQFATYLGEVALRLPVQLLLASLVVIVAVGPPSTSVGAAAATAVAILLSLTLTFLFAIGIGLSAFWFEDTAPFMWIFQKLVLTIGGVLLPMELLPPPLAAVAEKLPFAAMAYTPGRIFVGTSVEGALGALGFQLAWITAMGIAVGGIYSLGIRKVNINGG